MTDYLQKAHEIHRRLPVVDGHNDLPWAIRTRAANLLQEADPGHDLEGFHTDIPRLRRGGVGAVFWSVYVPAWSEQPLVDTLAQIELVNDMVTANPDHLELAGSAEDVVAIRSSGRIASLLGAEGGHCIEESLDNLWLLHNRGVRYLTLTHGATLPWADSATDDPRHRGLTGFGRDVVREMNRVGMVVDISHVAPSTMRHAIETSSHR